MNQPYEKAVEETAKAVQAVAKTSEKALESGNAFGRFLHTVFGDGFEQLGGAFGDWAYVFRLKQAAKLAEEVRVIHARRGIEGRTQPIPPGLGIPLLQAATLEDEPDLAKMWAALIANATDPLRASEIRRSYCGLLGSMEPVDAIVLMEVHRWRAEYPERGSMVARTDDEMERQRSLFPEIDDMVAKLNITQTDAAIALENLVRLGLVCDFMPTPPDEDPNGLGGVAIPGQWVPITHKHAFIDLTHMGVALVRACSA